MDRIKRVSSVLLAMLVLAVMLPVFITPDTSVEAAEAGVVTNGGFETYESYTGGSGQTAYKAEGWTVRDWGVTLGASGQSGKGVQLSKDSSHKGATSLTQVVPVNTNATYTFSFYTKAGSWTSGCDTLYGVCFTYSIDLGDSSSSFTATVADQVAPKYNNSNWTQTTVTVTTGSNKYLRIRFISTGEGGSDSYLDTVALTVVNAGDTGTHAKPTLKSFGTEKNRPASSSDNVIKEPGFESTTNAQWNTADFLKQGVSIVSGGGADGDAHSGSKFLKYYHGSVAYTEWPMFEFVCPTAGEYVFSAWVRTPLLSANNVGAASIGIINPDTGKFLTYGNAGGSYDGHYSNPETQLRSTATDNDWHLRSVTFYVGASNSTVKIGMYGLKSTMYVDDISVHLLSKGVKYTGNQTGTLSASTSVTNKFCKPENSLVPDSSFNADISQDFWTQAASGWNNGFLEFGEDETTSSRKTSLHFKGTNPASNKTYRYIKFIDVEPNTSYTVSFDYRVVKAGNPLVFIDNNIVRNAEFHTPNLGSTSNSWKTYAATFNTGNYNRIGIVFKDGTGEVYFDDFRFFKTSDGIATEPAEEQFPTLKHNVINGEKEKVTTSVTEDNTGLQGYGLAFQFKLACTGAAWNAGDWTTDSPGKADWSADFSNAYIDAFEDGGSYKLVKVGAVMTNKEDVGTDEKAFKLENTSSATNSQVINVDVKYLWENPADKGYITHVMRIINIPETHLSTLIYARPYYVFEYEGQQVTMYGDIVSECYEEYPEINDGWLEWD